MAAAAPTAARPPGQALAIRTGADGSFSLWSEAFGEGFHSGRGALREACETFLLPSELERFPPGSSLRVLEVCVGTGCNLAVLLEACADRGLQLAWTGLELDPEPLRLALSQPAFRAPWRPQTLLVLEQLQRSGGWDGPGAAGRFAGIRAGAEVLPAIPPGGGSPPLQAGSSRGRMLWGDARRTLQALRQPPARPFDLIWHDAFSPRRCPQLWTLEFLRDLSSLLRPEGRWISYCSAAAVREALQLAGLQQVALNTAQQPSGHQRAWSGGSAASPRPLPPSPLWRALSPMEHEHLASAAGEPYRDPTGEAQAEVILAARQRAQAQALANGCRGSSSAWRKRWGVET